MNNNLALSDDGYTFLEDVRSGRVHLGDGIKCELDRYLRYTHGQLNIVVGHANVGKTAWIVFYFTALALHHNKKFLVYSSENSIGSLKRKIIEFYSNSQLTNLGGNEFSDCKSFISRHFRFVKTDKAYTAHELIDICSEVHAEETYDGLVIDPYNSLRIPRDVRNAHDYHYEVAHDLRIFSKKKNVSVYVCAHAVTEALRKTHSSDHVFQGHPMPPGSSDIEGGGKWVNRADDFIVIHRYTQHPMRWMETHINIRKVKEQETGGKPTFIDEPIIFTMVGGTAFSCDNVNSIEQGKFEYAANMAKSQMLL